MLNENREGHSLAVVGPGEKGERRGIVGSLSIDGKGDSRQNVFRSLGVLILKSLFSSEFGALGMAEGKRRREGTEKGGFGFVPCPMEAEKRWEGLGL